MARAPELPLVFIGGGRDGYGVLEHLLKIGCRPGAVIGMADHGHEEPKFEPRMRALCARADLRHAGSDLAPAEMLAVLESGDLASMLVVQYRRLIPESVYGRCRAAVGAHFSLLPQYRGFAPVNWAVLNGETSTGVSLFHLAEMDRGDIVEQEQLSIGPDETAGEVSARALELLKQLVERNIAAIAAGTARRSPQNEADATYTCARVPDDGRIDWSRPARQVHNLVRALAHPFPGAFTTLDGRKFKVWKTGLPAAPRRYVGIVPGRVVGIGAEAVEVLAGDGPLELRLVQCEGGEPAPPAGLIRSIRATLGT